MTSTDNDKHMSKPLGGDESVLTENAQIVSRLITHNVDLADSFRSNLPLL